MIFIFFAVVCFLMIGGLKNRREIKRIDHTQTQQHQDQQKIRREQERQAEILRRHEQRIRKLEFEIRQAAADIKAEQQKLAQLFAILDIVQAEQINAVPGSPADVKAQKQIMAIENQVAAAEKKLRKAQFTRQEAERQLAS